MALGTYYDYYHKQQAMFTSRIMQLICDNYYDIRHPLIVSKYMYSINEALTINCVPRGAHFAHSYWVRIVHYNDVIMGEMASQISSLTIVYSTVYAGADQRIYQSSASLAFVRGIHRWPVKSPHKGTVTRKMLPFDDIIMIWPELLPSTITVWLVNFVPA